MLCSIVVPVYRNAESLPLLWERLNQVAVQLAAYRFEFVFVDDGSSDSSLSVLKQLREQDPRIQIVKLTRNFGSPNALWAGFEHAHGDLIGNVAADLQDPPETFIPMVALIEKGEKVVVAIRSEREDRSLLSNLFYRIMRRFAYRQFPDQGFDMILAKREVIQKLRAMREKNTPPITMLIWSGFAYGTVFYKRVQRAHGKSQFSFEKKLKFSLDSFITFSYFPIRFMSFLGLVVSFASLCLGGWIILNALFGQTQVPGWASLIALLALLMGMTMSMLGVIGEYLWRTLDECRKREPYVVDEILPRRHD